MFICSFTFVRVDLYFLAFLADFAQLYGLAPEKFAENVHHMYAVHEVNSYSMEPIEVAKQKVTAQFPEPEDVINATNFMVANQLAMEPGVRKAVREKLFQSATVNVRPTKKGFKEIDETHVLYRSVLFPITSLFSHFT
jgi:transcription elongation factor SPT6